MHSFNSQIWFEHIKKMANAYGEAAEKKVVVYDEKNIDLIEQKYYSRLQSLKKEIYDESDLAAKKN